MATRDIQLVFKQDMGRGLTFNPQTEKWEVDVPTGGGSATPFDLPAELAKLPKRDWQDGDYGLGIGKDGQMQMIKLCCAKSSFPSFECKLPYKVSAESNVGVVGGRVGLTYEFTNKYDNAVTFKFLIADSAAGRFTLLEGPTKVSGGGTVRNLNNQQVNIQVDALPPGDKITFNVAITPQDPGRYSFAVHGLADASGGNKSGLNTCGNSGSVNVLDDGSHTT